MPHHRNVNTVGCCHCYKRDPASHEGRGFLQESVKTGQGLVFKMQSHIYTLLHQSKHYSMLCLEKQRGNKSNVCTEEENKYIYWLHLIKLVSCRLPHGDESQIFK